jgi:hypothetical protein
LPADGAVPCGSSLGYHLASLKNFVQAAWFAGASEDDIFDVVCAGIEWARQAGVDDSAVAPVMLEAAG